MDVLLDENHGQPGIPECLERSEQLIDEDRRQAQRRLVDNQNLRIGHQPAGDRKHLLLAARERAGLLPPALLEARKLK
jgi:hypothetical protein